MDNLTYREKQIVHCINQAMSNKQIARELFTSERSIERSLQNIYDKTGTRGRVSLALFYERSKQYQTHQ
jgi:DNA-binding NarL/FixJ family response regulator